MSLPARILVSEVERAARARDAAARCQARAPLPPRNTRPPAARQPASLTASAVAGLCVLAVLAGLVILLARMHNQADVTIANEETCTIAVGWAPAYDIGLDNELDDPAATPDLQLRADVQRLLAAISGAQVAGYAVVPDRAVRRALKAVRGDCNRLQVNPDGNNASSIP